MSEPTNPTPGSKGPTLSNDAPPPSRETGGALSAAGSPGHDQLQEKSRTDTARVNVPHARWRPENAPAVTREFNDAANRAPAQSRGASGKEKAGMTKIIDNEQFREKLRASAEKRRAEIVKKMNDDRPAPNLTVEHTPSGPVTQMVNTPEAERKNKEIDQRIQRYKEQMEKTRGTLKKDFNRSR